MSTTPTKCGRAGGVCAVFIISLFIASGAAAADVLFPAPLHITREVSGPFSDRKHVIDEYCHGNRVVSISGRRTAIADHAKREITLIDFAAGTYSITKFEDVARAQAHGATRQSAKSEWRVESRGGRVVASRPGEHIEAERKNESGRQLIRLTADRQIKLSRAAAEALLGTGDPNPATEAGEIVIGALRSSPSDRRVSTTAAASDEYFLPLEYDVAFDVEGELVETRNVVTRIGNELPPPDLVALPPGAKLVESDAVTAHRLLRELDGELARPTH